jgi:hypothetical protein
MRDLRASRQRAQDALERLRVDLGLERRVFIFTNPKYAIQLGFSVTGTVAAQQRLTAEYSPQMSPSAKKILPSQFKSITIPALTHAQAVSSNDRIYLPRISPFFPGKTHD